MSFLRLARALPRQALAVPCRQAPLALPRRQVQLPFRAFSAGGGLSTEAIQKRILNVLEGFETVNHDKVRTLVGALSNLTQDLLADTNRLIHTGFGSR
jgi:NADH dehydrogenase (ubiquinone) 1 alpha/beta subcomplex 1